MIKLILAFTIAFLFFSSLFLLLTFKLYKPFKNKALIRKFHKGAFAFGLFEAIIVAFASLL